MGVSGTNTQVGVPRLNTNNYYIIYRRNCINCGNQFNTRNKDKTWCNGGHCKNVICGKKSEIVVIDERVIKDTKIT